MKKSAKCSTVDFKILHLECYEIFVVKLKKTLNHFGLVWPVVVKPLFVHGTTIVSKMTFRYLSKTPTMLLSLFRFSKFETFVVEVQFAENSIVATATSTTMTHHLWLSFISFEETWVSSMRFLSCNAACSKAEVSVAFNVEVSMQSLGCTISTSFFIPSQKQSRISVPTSARCRQIVLKSDFSIMLESHKMSAKFIRTPESVTLHAEHYKLQQYQAVCVQRLLLHFFWTHAVSSTLRFLIFQYFVSSALNVVNTLTIRETFW